MRSNDYLAHHGIKGMRWGVRRDRRSSGGSIRGKTKKTIPKENSFSKDYKDMKNMTNKELRNAINRLELEKQYSMLVKNDVSAGRRAVTSFMKDLGTSIAADVISDLAKEGINTGIDYLRDRN